MPALPKKPILVIGGGISGITTAIEIAETGRSVILIEKKPYLGGQVVRMNNYFPKLCPPTCGLEINFRRIKDNESIDLLTNAEVVSFSGLKGNFSVTILKKAEYINDNCTLCGECATICPEERLNEFNYRLDKTKAAYLPHEMAYPQKYHIDKEVCTKENCAKCKTVCKYNAIDFSVEDTTLTLDVSSIVLATGWEPYQISKEKNYHHKEYFNVISNVEMERYLASNGPTGGKLLLNGNTEEPESVAFVLCAGSRDENFLPYCSGVCCSASLKQALTYSERNPNAKISIFYIDLRVTGRNEDFLNRVQDNKNIELIKGKVGKVEKDDRGKILVTAEDIMSGKKSNKSSDLVVLASGIVPVHPEFIKLNTDAYGFIMQDNLPEGIYVVACAKKPMDVSTSLKDATGAALKAIQILD